MESEVKASQFAGMGVRVKKLPVEWEEKAYLGRKTLYNLIFAEHYCRGREVIQPSQ